MDMELAGDPQPDHHHRLAGFHGTQLLGVITRRQHLDQRRFLVADPVRQNIDVGFRHCQKIGEATILIAADEGAVGANIDLSGLAMKTGAAIGDRIDDDAAADGGAVLRCFGDFADHFVTHDARVIDGNTARMDFQIGAADARMGHPYQHLAGTPGRLVDFTRLQHAGAF